MIVGIWMFFLEQLIWLYNYICVDKIFGTVSYEPEPVYYSK